MQKIIQNKEPWTEIKQVLMEITSNYTELDKLNRILWIITRENRELKHSLVIEDKIGELRLIHNIKKTLKICKFSINHDQCREM